VNAGYLTVEDVARRYGVSKRTVHELTRNARIPHRVLPHTRRCLFTLDELEAHENGCQLERVDLRDGGRIVRPR
jgi:excisionase family DNA binding protein